MSRLGYNGDKQARGRGKRNMNKLKEREITFLVFLVIATNFLPAPNPSLHIVIKVPK